MSWTCQITAESSGQWACSALHFATKEEAEKYMLMMREHASRIARVVESRSSCDRFNCRMSNTRIGSIARTAPEPAGHLQRYETRTRSDMYRDMLWRPN
jgi:hypothetical protein